MQAFRDGAEHAVPRFMAQAVVDPLEAVEIDEEERRARTPLAACERVREPVEEEGAIRQAGEQIVGRLVGQTRLQHLTLPDIAPDPLYPHGPPRLVTDQARRDFERQSAPIPGEDRELPGRAILADHGALGRPAHAIAVFGRHQIVEVERAVVRQGVARQTFGGPVQRDQATAQVVGVDEVAGVVEEVAEARLARAQRRFGPCALDQLLLRGRVEPGILQRDRPLVGEQPQQAGVVVGEAAATLVGPDDDHPQRDPAADQRDAERGPQTGP